jgi:hypothetical protein
MRVGHCRASGNYKYKKCSQLEATETTERVFHQDISFQPVI